MSQTAIFVHLRKTVIVSLDGLKSLLFVRDWPDPMQILLYVPQYIIQVWYFIHFSSLDTFSDIQIFT